MVLINFTERCVTHDIFSYFEKLTRTYGLLTVLVQDDIITEKQREEIIDEMIENGFWIKK